MRIDKNTTPTAFISYSWDNDEHKEWVREFAARLRADGVDVTLDQWHAIPGDQLPQFMETAVRENDYVIAICTPRYRERSDNRAGGVGYEGDIMTAEVSTTRNNRKFIPVLCRGDWSSSAPSWLKGKYYIDLSGTPYSKDGYADLITTIHGTRPAPPPIGKPPSHHSPVMWASRLASDPKSPIKITGVIVDDVTTPRMDGTRGSALYAVPFQLSRRPSIEWAEAFEHTWNHPPSWTNMHRPGIARVSGDRVILDGTTIEEVQNVHRETLVLVVNRVNELIEEYEAKKQRQAEAEAAKLAKHRNQVNQMGRKIRFE
jgi:TIR domain